MRALDLYHWPAVGHPIRLEPLPTLVGRGVGFLVGRKVGAEVGKRVGRRAVGAGVICRAAHTASGLTRSGYRMLMPFAANVTPR
jgi:hypothetical protein